MKFLFDSFSLGPIQKPTESERGTALILLVALLPFLLLFLIGTFTIGSQSVFQSKSLHLCRTEGLKVHTKVASTLNQLLKLNTLAQQLRIERKITQAQLAAAIAAPQALAAAKRADDFVKAKQHALQTRQSYLIQLMKIQLQTGNLMLRQQLSQLGVKSLHGPIPKLHLISSPSGSLTPDYQPAPAFTELSKIQLSWSIPTKVNPGFYEHSSLQNNSLSTICTTGLKERLKQWQASLLAAK